MFSNLKYSLLYYQGSFPIYSNRIAVNVVDNVLLVHQMDAKVVIIYDLFVDSHAPVSSPLPLLMRGLPKSNDATSQSMCQKSEASEEKELSNAETIMYGDDWTFLVPDFICDAGNGLSWKVYLDLEVSFHCLTHCVVTYYCYLTMLILPGHFCQQL